MTIDFAGSTEYKNAKQNFEESCRDLQTETGTELRKIADDPALHGWYRRAAVTVLKARNKK